ncbi:cache domain-containing protein [Pelosinus sp. sgz500959]|uniref:sensor histidine kinase n=1 Tax=Pelosinus sp. sgz500959 TaxID=3242472 RepID=UPI00366CC1B7
MKVQTLRQQFRLWTILLVLIPSLLVMVIYTVGQIKLAKEENLKLISQRVYSQKRLIDYWMAERVYDVHNLSESEDFRILDEQQMQKSLSLTQRNNQNFDSFSYIDKDGFFRISTLNSAIKYPSTRNQPYFEAALAGKEYISNVVIGRNSGLPIINFSSPIFDYAGNLQGLILGSVRTTTLETLLRDNWIGQTGEIFLVNQEGTMLTEPRHASLLMDKGLIGDTARMKFKIATDAFHPSQITDSGTAEWTDYLGNKVLGSYLHVPERGWTIIGKINEEEVLGPIYKQLALMASGTIALLFLIIPLATLITNRIKRPLDWLIKQSGLITLEHYEMVARDRPPESISHELDILCTIFVRMSQKIADTVSLLKKNETKLEHKVHERTIELSDMNIALEEEIAQHQAANRALKDSRDALAISESRYKDLFDYMHNGCSYHKVRFDEENNPIDLEYIHVNHAYEKYAGYLASELIGKGLTDIFPHINNESFNWIKAYATVAISGEPISFTQYFEHQQRWYSISAYSPTKDHVAVISEDVTKFITLQKEITRMDRLNLIGNMAAGLAHEIRNPMTVVKGYLQHFKRKIPNILHDQLDLVLSELARIETIITDFLAISKTKSTEQEKQDLNEIINKIAPLLLTDALKRGMNLEFKLSRDIPQLILAEKEIKQLLLNLAMNGLNAMKQHGTLTIETKYQDGSVILCIEDSGCGIPKDLQEKIFDPFFTTRDDGTGLGLSVCASIVERHSGIIKVDSEEGKGTRFVITFPVEKN